MKTNNFTYKELLGKLSERNLVSSEEIRIITNSLKFPYSQASKPLYIKILIGTGAWFSALFLCSFILILNDNPVIIMGGTIFFTIAIALSHLRKNVFFSQTSLAFAFSGNLILVAKISGCLEKSPSLATAVLSHLIICVILYPLVANNIYRFLAPTALAILATVWMFDEKLLVLMYGLIAFEIIFASVLLLREKNWGFNWLRPLIYSSAIMLPVTLLTINLIQNWKWHSYFYVPLLPSGILTAAFLIFLFLYFGGIDRLIKPWMILAIVSAILLGSFTSPGIIAALALLIIGIVLDDRILTVLSHIFLILFLFLFYYSLDINLAYKSWIVGGSGVILLLVYCLVKLCERKEATL